MFDSGIKVNKLIENLKNEVDIAIEIPDETYIEWLNSLQHMLYTEVIKEQKKVIPPAIIHIEGGSVGEAFGGGNVGSDETTQRTEYYNPVIMSDIAIDEGENQPIFEDIYTVYADTTQLIKTTLASSDIFPNSFYKVNNNMGYKVTENPEELIIIYLVKPALVTTEDYANTNVMIPIEFIDLVKAKLRGEAYKLANEDALAAKWLNDYNVLLETFKKWITDKSAKFGM